MDYTQITLTISPEKLEEFLNVLYEHDICELAIEDPADVDFLMDKKKQYEWDYVDSKLLKKSEVAKVNIYLDKGGNENAVIAILDEILADPEFSDVKIATENVNENDWKDVWKEFFKPTRITEKITIKPSWEEYESGDDGELVIAVDPGMAFGTGTHETTALCIKLLEKYGDRRSMLDVGTGSGILSIAAKKLGIGSVTAVDIDPVCVDIAKENLGLNGIDDVSVFEGDLTKGLNLKVDLVVANLMADLVMYLSASVGKHLSTGGIFISSGILTEKEGEVIRELEKNNFAIVEVLEQGEWCAIAAKLRDE